MPKELSKIGSGTTNGHEGRQLLFVVLLMAFVGAAKAAHYGYSRTTTVLWALLGAAMPLMYLALMYWLDRPRGFGRRRSNR